LQDEEAESFVTALCRNSGKGVYSRLAKAGDAMPIAIVHCPVIGSNVTRVTDLEDQPTKIICSEYQEPTGICRLKKRAQEGGMLSQLLERVSEGALDTKDVRCVLR
jgi:hypothetical protein